MWRESSCQPPNGSGVLDEYVAFDSAFLTVRSPALVTPTIKSQPPAGFRNDANQVVEDTELRLTHVRDQSSGVAENVLHA